MQSWCSTVFPFIALNVWLIFSIWDFGWVQHMSHLTGIRQADASCCGALLKACEGGGRWREATGMKAVKFAVDVSVVFWCDFKAWRLMEVVEIVRILGLHFWLMKDIMPCRSQHSHFTGAELVAFATRASMAVWTYILTQLSNKPFGLSVNNSRFHH